MFSFTFNLTYLHKKKWTKITEKEIYTLRTTMLCYNSFAGGVMGPLFFEDVEGATVPVNGD